MFKSLVVLNGDFPSDELFYKLSRGRTIFCCDGGADHLFRLSVVPEAIVGDLDSISEVSREFYLEKTSFVRYPVDKDQSDAEKMLEYLADKSDDVLVIGGLGGRLDHTMFNISLLANYSHASFVDDNQIIRSIQGESTFQLRVGTTVSFMATSEESIVSLSGFKFSGRDLVLRVGETLGLSNLTTSENVVISSSKPILMFCNSLSEELFLSDL